MDFLAKKLVQPHSCTRFTVALRRLPAHIYAMKPHQMPWRLLVVKLQNQLVLKARRARKQDFYRIVYIATILK